MTKENKLSREEIKEHIDYVFKECRICAEHHNYDCVDCPHYEKCYQIHAHLKKLIEAQTEPSEAELEKLAEKWAKGLKQLYINCDELISRFWSNLPRILLIKLIDHHDKLRRGNEEI